mgnify:FL=1
MLSELRKQLGKKVLPTAGWDQASLKAYEEFQDAPEQFFPTDPTEASACLGGMAACNASGARSYAYGPMRPHITGLHVALTDGDLVELQRGEVFAQGRRLSLVTVQGRTLELDLPAYTMPKTKKCFGLFCCGRHGCHRPLYRRLRHARRHYGARDCPAAGTGGRLGCELLFR